MKTKNTLLIALLATLTISGCSIGNHHVRHGENASSTLGNVSVAENGRGGHLSTVNGNVEIGANAQTKSAETINGNVEVGNNSQTGALETVNGSINLGTNSIVDGNVETVNGGITLDANALVKGDIKITNGKVELNSNATVSGNIVFEYTNFSSFLNRNFERSLTIAEGAVVGGKIILYTPVTLDLPNDFDQSKIENRMEDLK